MWDVKILQNTENQALRIITPSYISIIDDTPRKSNVPVLED